MKFQLLLFAFFFQLHSNLGQSSSPSTSNPSSLASTASSSSPTISGSSNNPTTTTTTTESNNNNGGDGWFVVPGKVCISSPKPVSSYCSGIVLHFMSTIWCLRPHRPDHFCDDILCQHPLDVSSFFSYNFVCRGWWSRRIYPYQSSSSPLLILSHSCCLRI